MDRFIEIKNLVKDFHGRGFLNRRKAAVRAVDRVSFNIDRNTVFGLVGESGCGKTTLVRSILYLDPPTSGEIRVDGVSLDTLSSHQLRSFRKKMQIVFHDPKPEPLRIQCLEQTQPNSVQMQNPYTFNNVSNGDNDFIGVYDGSYTLTGVTSSHPIGFVINDTTKFEVTSGTLYGSKTREGVSTNYYTCETEDIVFEVKGNFGTISYDCYHHGYMGGQNRLKYSDTCPVYEHEYVLEFKTEFKPSTDIGNLSTHFPDGLTLIQLNNPNFILGATTYEFSVWDFNNNTTSTYYQFTETYQTHTNSGFNFTLPGVLQDRPGVGILPVTVTNGVPTTMNNTFQTIFQVGGDCTLAKIKSASDINGNSIELNKIKINGAFFS